MNVMNNASRWNAYIGSIWEDIFRKINLKKTGSIIEVAPGSINKIGLGLKNYGFNGKVYIIEPNKKSLDTITNNYKQLLSQSNIIPIRKPLSDITNNDVPLTSCDALVSNHPLDDMIIGYCMNNKDFDALFDDHYTNPSIAEITNRWDILNTNKELLSNIKDSILHDWKKIITMTKPQNVVISQYESYFFKSNNIQLPDMHAQELLSKLKSYYSINKSNHNYYQLMINNNKIFNHNAWLIMRQII